MNKDYLLPIAVLIIMLLLYAAQAKAAERASPGKQAFMKHCAVCHANGGNLISPADTLDKKTLASNGVQKPSDIMHLMRNPGPGMTKFDKNTIPDNTAKAIADYILKTFK